MPKVKPVSPNVGRVLLTRPADKNNALSQLLSAHGFSSLSCPFLSVTPVIDDTLAYKLGKSDIVISISANAVCSARQQLEYWPECLYFAVGKATAEMLLLDDIHATVPDDPRTEGLLLLPQLQQLTGKNIVILRGNGGRETLAQQLRLRGATVVYGEVYRRDVVLQCKNVVKQWQQYGITTIVVTSAEILQILVKLVNNGYQPWLDNITIIVPSARVSAIASELGVPNVIIANGADNQAILDKLLNIQSSFYEKQKRFEE